MNMNSSTIMNKRMNMAAANTMSIANAVTNIIVSMNTVTATAAVAVAAAAPMPTTMKRKKPSFHLPCSAFRRCL